MVAESFLVQLHKLRMAAQDAITLDPECGLSVIVETEKGGITASRRIFSNLQRRLESGVADDEPPDCILTVPLLFACGVAALLLDHCTRPAIDSGRQGDC